MRRGRRPAPRGRGRAMARGGRPAPRGRAMAGGGRPAPRGRGKRMPHGGSTGRTECPAGSFKTADGKCTPMGS